MRNILLFLMFLLLPFTSIAKEVKDTLYTRQGDKVIVSCQVSSSGNEISIMLAKPRIIPSEALRKECKGDLERLKVVIFDKLGNHSKVNWSGKTPSAFMVPNGFTYDQSEEGFYIFGESSPMIFSTANNDTQKISLPLYVALYEKKRSYKIIEACSQPLSISLGDNTTKKVRNVQIGSQVEQIAVQTSEEIEADNGEITKALNSIRMIKQLLETETELPVSQTLSMELSNLRGIQDRIKDPEVLSKINDVFLDFNRKERELKEAQKSASLAAQAQEQVLLAQQKAEEDAKLKEAEERNREKEEKQQKQTLWMIIGGVLLAIIGFIGNALFKHFRDIKNQKSIMEMQESLAKQAQHEAGRRSREIIRNKTHQVANKGRSKLRESLREGGTSRNKTNRKSI